MFFSRHVDHRYRIVACGMRSSTHQPSLPLHLVYHIARVPCCSQDVRSRKLAEAAQMVRVAQSKRFVGIEKSRYLYITLHMVSALGRHNVKVSRHQCSIFNE